MKRAKRRLPPAIKPRNPLALNPLLGKGGRHERKGKKASRARLKARCLREGQG